MSTDRELLELAAKAAGYPWRGFSADGRPMLNADVSKPEPRLCCPRVWNPLTDDGDALRLAVQLRLGVIPFANDVSATQGHTGREWAEPYGSDPGAAARRAIVRAAAGIGKAMP